MTDRYSNREMIGEGGFGEVYKAVDKETGKHCALKRIKQIDQTALTEVETLQQVKGHPNVVKIDSYFISGGSLWLVTEFCEGGDLNKFFWDKKPDVSLKFRLMTQISSGVAFLHEKGVAHRDLKPENILIGFDEYRKPVAKLTDFGLAKIHCGDQMSCRYMTTCAGTAFFIAPEVLTNPYTVKADVFSMGLIFRAMVFETGLPCGGSGHYLVAFLTSEGFIIPFGEALAANPNLVVKVSEKAIANPSARQLLDSMLLRDDSLRLSAAAVADALSALSPSDFETSTQKDSERPVSSGQKVETTGRQLLTRLTDTVRSTKPKPSQSQADAAAILCDAVLSEFTSEELNTLKEKILILYIMISRNSSSVERQNMDKWIGPVLKGIDQFLCGQKLQGSDAARFAIGWLQFTSMIEKT